MKALAIDTSVSKFSIAAKNEDKSVTAIYDVGMKQSEFLLPSIDYVLEKAELKPNELDCTIVSSGPGSFTGLRLAFAACKALTLSNGTPLYSIPTLQAYANSYRQLPFLVVPLIDAKKERFYSAVYYNDKTILEAGDYSPEQILIKLKIENGKMKTESDAGGNCQFSNSKIILCGPDAELFLERVMQIENGKLKNESGQMKNESSDDGNCQLSILNYQFLIMNSNVVTDSLFDIVQEKIKKGEAPSEDYDAPLYIRVSEAEEKLFSKNV